MMRHGNWTKHSCALLLAVALSSLAGCGGDPPSTLTPTPVDKPDAGGAIADGGAPDSGVIADGGSGLASIKSLRVVGDPLPEVVFEGKIALQAVLLHSETGAVAGETVDFTIVTGAGTLSTETATTDAIGIARVEFTAGTAGGMVRVAALASDVAEEDRAVWAISVVEPVRTLERVGLFSSTLIDGESGSLSAKLTQGGRPVAGAKVTFSASLARLLIDGQAVASKVATTNLLGVATVEVRARSIQADDSNVDVTARADYASSVSYKVLLTPKPPCETNVQCEASQICADGECIPRPQCSDDYDILCNEGFECVNGACVPVDAPSCAETGVCPDGQYCDVDAEICLTGCDDDEDCAGSQICDASHRCVTPTLGGCEDDADCEQDYLCIDGECIYTEAPNTTLDVSGEWNMVQVFHVGTMLPANISDVLVKVDQAFAIASAVVGGQVGDLLPDYVPDAIKDAISAAVAQAAGDYLPEWATDVVHIGTDVLRVIKDFEIRSVLTLEQPFNGVAADVSGKDEWQAAVFYWYTSDCPPPAANQQPDECALMEIDLTSSGFGGAPSTVVNGEVQVATLAIDPHQVSFQYGLVVRKLLEMAIEALTGYETIEAAIRGYVDCGAINDWAQEMAVNLLGNVSWLLELVGMTAEEVAENLNVTGQCNDALGKAAKLITDNIEGLAVNVPVTMDGSATITREPANTSSYADHLVRGKWSGRFGNDALINPSLADWYADR